MLGHASDPPPVPREEEVSFQGNFLSKYGDKRGRCEHAAQSASHVPCTGLRYALQQVLPGFKALAPWLNDRPSMLLRSWATPKVAHLLSALKLKKCTSRAALLAAWDAEPAFLFKEVSAWVHKAHRAQLQAMWPLGALAPGERESAKPLVGSKALSGEAGVGDEGGFVSGSESEGDSD